MTRTGDRPGWPRRALAAAAAWLQRAAGRVRRWAERAPASGDAHADGGDPVPAGDAPQGGPPADWLERVRRGAPQLLAAMQRRRAASAPRPAPVPPRAPPPAPRAPTPRLPLPAPDAPPAAAARRPAGRIAWTRWPAARSGPPPTAIPPTARRAAPGAPPAWPGAPRGGAADRSMPGPVSLPTAPAAAPVAAAPTSGATAHAPAHHTPEASSATVPEREPPADVAVETAHPQRALVDLDCSRPAHGEPSPRRATAEPIPPFDPTPPRAVTRLAPTVAVDAAMRPPPPAARLAPPDPTSRPTPGSIATPPTAALPRATCEPSWPERGPSASADPTWSAAPRMPRAAGGSRQSGAGDDAGPEHWPALPEPPAALAVRPALVVRPDPQEGAPWNA